MKAASGNATVWFAVASRQLNDMGRFAIFAARALAGSMRPPWRMRLTLDQAFHLGWRAMPVALMTGLFVGMVIVLQTGYTLAAFNAKQYAPIGAGKALTRAMIPIFTALVIGARTAASIAAELGTMRVTEQIDALEVLDADPHRYLIVPRVIASTLMLPLMTVYVDLIGILGGMVVGVYALNISPSLYLNATIRTLTLGDVFTGLFKTVFFGAAMGICGCYHGLHARGGAEGVGQATTRAVVYTLMALILLEFILSSWIIYLEEALTRTFG